MKKLTAGIFTVLMGLVSVNAADAAVASKGYVTQEINKVNANVTAVDTKVGDLKYSSANYITQDEGLTVSAGKLDAAIKNLAGELSSLSGGQGSVAEQISNALSGVTATVTGDENGVITGVTQEKGKVTATRALITNDNIAGDAAIAVTKIDGLEAALAGKQDAALVGSSEGVKNKDEQYPSVAYTEYLINASKTDLAASKQDKFEAGNFLEFTTDGEGDTVLKTTYTGEANVVTISNAGEIGVAASGITTAKIADGNVTKAKLDSTVQASLDLADSALQATALEDTGAIGSKIKANADAIEGLKTADETINGKLDVLNGADTVDGSVAKALKDAKTYADGLAVNYDAAGAAATAEANAKEYALDKANDAQTNAVGYTDSVIAALQPITRVPAVCSDANKYCALTYGAKGFVWEVIERGDDELNEQGDVVYNPAAVTLAVNPTGTEAPGKPEAIK